MTQGLLEACGALQLVRSLDPPAGLMPVGRAFPGLHWRVIAPLHGHAGCPLSDAFAAPSP